MENPLDYDLTINTTRITIEEAPLIIVNTVRAESRPKSQKTCINESPNSG
jgi:hypothetical protein